MPSFWTKLSVYNLCHCLISFALLLQFVINHRFTPSLASPSLDSPIATAWSTTSGELNLIVDQRLWLSANLLWQTPQRVKRREDRHRWSLIPDLTAGSLRRTLPGVSAALIHSGSSQECTHPHTCTHRRIQVLHSDVYVNACMHYFLISPSLPFPPPFLFLIYRLMHPPKHTHTQTTGPSPLAHTYRSWHELPRTHSQWYFIIK